MIPITYIFIVLAIGIAIVAEILVAYQKYQMKRDFLKQLDQRKESPDTKEEKHP